MNDFKKLLNSDYGSWLAGLMEQIAVARQKAGLSLNEALIKLYWHLGTKIIEKEKAANWGSGFIDRLSRDLSFEFPDMKGFSQRNLYAIRQWYLFYSASSSIVPQPATQALRLCRNPLATFHKRKTTKPPLKEVKEINK